MDGWMDGSMDRWIVRSIAQSIDGSSPCINTPCLSQRVTLKLNCSDLYKTQFRTFKDNKTGFTQQWYLFFYPYWYQLTRDKSVLHVMWKATNYIVFEI